MLKGLWTASLSVAEAAVVLALAEEAVLADT
jgi:hypothetical protein